MDIYVFCNLLYDEMKKIGIPESKADKYIDNLRHNLSADDIARVTEKDIPKYARICADNILNQNTGVIEKQSRTVKSESPGIDTECAPTMEIRKPIRTMDSAPTMQTKNPETIETPHIEESLAEPLYDDPLPKATPKYVLVTILLSPLWALAAAIFMVPFIAMFASEVALIAALILLLAGCCALGTAASLTGIIYGIIKMFSVPSVGLYEIGFGVIIAGVSMICGILIYNGAVRFMPWLFRKSGHLLKFTFKKVKPLLAKYRRWLVK